MRKILSGFLATAMIVSVGSMATLAATPASTSASVSDVLAAATAGDIATTQTAGVDEFTVTLEFDDASPDIPLVFDLGLNFTNSTAGTVNYNQEILKAILSLKRNNIEINGKRFDLSFVSNGTLGFKAVLSPAAGISNLDDITFALTTTGTWATVPSFAGGASHVVNKGTGGVTADVTALGDIVDVSQVVECDGQGNPIPLTEGKVGVDEELNGQNGVQSGNTLYFMIKDGAWKFNDDSFWKLRISKGNNGKYVKNVDDVTKNFSKNLYNAVNGSVVDGTSGRHRFIKVELAEIFTDDEYKITLDLRFTPKSAAENQFQVNSDSELKVKDFSFWMKNMVKDADNDWKVGITGLMLNPLQNDWNEVTYFDEDGDLAFMKFFADSDVSKFYAKLSTKWEHADYASYFNDQDAYIFDFTGSPKISATSRCDLQIYNPFINSDGDETIDPASAVIYQVIDGDLFDVTDSFKYEEGENGDMAYTTRTRFLGTYIICEKAVEEAVDNTEEVPADLVPEDTTPVEVTPSTDNGGKAPANTGKYL